MPPLAERMRPRTLEQYFGQLKLVGPEAALRRSITNGKITSMILWGPPGVGKTTLAHIIANESKRPFHMLSAVNSGVKDVRETIQKAEKQKFFNTVNPILFIDEIHRFSKSQQDSLLGAVENGTVTLIGATTENPSFEVISALLSRCQVYVLEPLSKDELLALAQHAISSDSELKGLNIDLRESDTLIKLSGGDVRKLYNTIEIIVNQFGSGDEIVITNALVEQAVQANMVQYDKGGELHYDIISAFIKSIRGSDPNAAIYYLARMIAGGEDPKFICRRMVISASEDIGLANPNALLIANQCFEAVTNIGMPEGRIPMSQAAIYLACSPKSNSAYMAINKALALVKETGNLSVPLHLRNAPTKLMKELDYGKSYKYSHDYALENSAQEFLPIDISGSTLYEPLNNANEQKFANHLNAIWKSKYGNNTTES